MDWTPEFSDSYSRFTSYPTQLIYRNTYPAALKKCELQLESESRRGLCIKQDSDADIVFRDLDPTFMEPRRRNVFNDLELQAWLEWQVGLDDSAQVPLVPVVTLLPRPDPRCRFIYLWGGNSRLPLQLTRDSLARIMTYHQVTPTYLEFLYCFGLQEKPRDLGHSGFREQTLLSTPAKGPVIPALGRSGRHFQLCYNLKAPFLRKSPDPLWSIRPAAVHYQFDVESGNSVWIITKGNLELKERIDSLTDPKNGRPEDKAYSTPVECFISSLAIHLLLANWSTEEWRARIRALEDEIHESSFEALDASHAKGVYRLKYTPDHLFQLQGKSDKIHEAIMVMDGNIDVLTALKQYYKKLLKLKDFPLRHACKNNVIVFAEQIEEMIYDTRTQVSRAKLLARIASDRKDVISRRLDSQATESVESLTTSMYNVGVLSQTEASAMRVVTVLTMLYLPATFVSTFFSTDVVHYQNQSQDNSSSSSSSLNSNQSDGETSFSTIAMERWIEVTLPLTLVTVLIAWYLYHKSKQRIEKVTGISGALPLFRKPMWIEEQV